MAKFLDENGVLYLWTKIKSLFVQKEAGKGLSSEDFTSAEKTKLAGITTGATKITVDASLSSTSTNPVQNKAVNTALGNKVDKVTGKQLSTEDYTSAEKTKLAGLENYVLPTAGTNILGGVKTTSTVASTSGLTACPIINGNVYYKNTTYSAATASANGLMTKEDFAKLAAFGDASAYALKSDITGMYKYKGSVATVDKLPKTAETGDVYDVQSTGMNYAWTGSAWDALGEVFSITAITNAEIDAIIAG